MYSLVEPGCFHVLPSMQWGAIPRIHPTISEYLGESCRGQGTEGWKVEVPIRRFGVDDVYTPR